MTILQRKQAFAEATLLKVNPDIFAEIVGHLGPRSAPVYQFKIKFNLALNTVKNIKDYESVVLTVLKTESQPATQIVNKNPGYTSNKVGLPDNGINKILYPTNVAQKIFSGLKIVKDYVKKEEAIFKKEINISTYTQDVVESFFDVQELSIPENKPIKSSEIPRSIRAKTNIADVSKNGLLSINVQRSSLKIDPNNNMWRVNKELYDLISPVDDPTSAEFSSESDLDNLSIDQTFMGRGKPNIFYDSLKYYLSDISESPSAKNYTHYELKNVKKRLDYAEVEVDVPIPYDLKDSNLTVKFDLLRTSSKSIEETVTTTLYVSSHVEAYEIIKSPPGIKVNTQHNNDSRTLRSQLTSYILEIEDREKNGKTKSFNVYIRSIEQTGSVTPYKLLGSVINGSKNELNFRPTSKLSVLKIVPVDVRNVESNVCSYKIVGTSYSSIGVLCAIPYHFGRSDIQVDVYNIPKDVISLKLFKRDVTVGIDSEFQEVDTISVQKNVQTVIFKDSSVLPGFTYEYYVVGTRFDSISQSDALIFSEFVIIKLPVNSVMDKIANVTLAAPIIQKETSTDEVTVSFSLSTDVLPTEKSRITEILKTQLGGELYDQLLNPANNSSSPLGDDSGGVPNYSSIFCHEISRSNINTGEREVFTLVGDGTFQDSPSSRSISNIKSINPLHSYVYHVSSFKKNPFEMLKRYISTGTDSSGRQWFYRPYKWKMPRVLAGNLYPDDENGFPVIDSYESFTSEPLGLTAVHKVDGSTKYVSVKNVVVDRIDRDTVKIAWDVEGISSVKGITLYESFVVLKVVNGIRSTLGSTHKNFIYHELSSKDIGSIYYIVVPVTAEYDIDDPVYSDEIIVTPDGLTPKTKITGLLAALLKAANEGNSQNTKEPRSLTSNVISPSSVQQDIVDNSFTKPNPRFRS